MESTGTPGVPAREPYGTCKVHVRYLATPWPKKTQITHRTFVHVATKSRNAYEWSRAVGMGSRTGLWPLGSPYEIILFRRGWSHAYGRSMVICFLWNHYNPYVYPTSSIRCTYGNRTGSASCGCLTGLWTRNCLCGAIRNSKHPYVVHKSHERLF